MRRILLVVLLSFAPATPLFAQRDTIPAGVSLATRYSKAGRPLVAVRPFVGAEVIRQFAGQIEGIITNDLTLSDRFEMIPAPQTLAQGPVDYAAWNSINVTYLITADVTVTAAGYDVALTVHDVVYGNVKQSRTFSVPAATTPDFRMAVHAVSDAVVRSITNQPGAAATRVVFVRQNGNGSNDLMIVDADGENLRRLSGSPGLVYSPAWSPDGSRIAYAAATGEGSWSLVERDMTAGRARNLIGASLVQSPAYAPNGSIVFAMWMSSGRDFGNELHVWDGSRAQRITNTGGENISPSVSPDGSQVAFKSTRTGAQHIYVMPIGGGNALAVSPLGERAEYHAPDWSPTGNDVVFHGISRGAYQLMRANAARPGGQVLQLTSSGRSEDPSYAPDGRHIVYTGVGTGGPGLYVIDVVTGETRQLVRGPKLRMADWSGSLARAATGSIP